MIRCPGPVWNLQIFCAELQLNLFLCLESGEQVMLSPFEC